MQKSPICEKKKDRLESAFEVLLSLVLFLIPFFSSNLFWDKYDLPKILLLSLLVPVLLLLLVISRETLQFSFLSVLLGALSVYSFASAMVNYLLSTGYQPKLILGTLRNQLNPLVFALLALLSVAVANSRSASFQKKALASGFSVLAVLTLLNFFLGQAEGAFGGRAFSFAGNPVFLGSVLAIGAAYMLSLEELNSSYRFPLVALAGASIATTGTRVALLAFVVSLVAFALLSGKKARIFAAASLVPAVGTYLLLFSNRFKTALSDLFSRLDLYRAAILGIFDRPVTGHGFSSYESFFRRLELSKRYLNIIGEVPDSSHSALLDFAFFSGIPAFFFIIVFFVRLFFTVPAFAFSSLVIFKFLPVSVSVITSFVAASVLLALEKDRFLTLSVKGSNKVVAGMLVAAVCLVFFYTGFKAAAANYYFEKAIKLYESQDTAGALDMLDISAKLMPYDSSIFITQARILKETALRSGSTELSYSALEKLDAAENIDPFNYEVQILKTDILSMLGKNQALQAGNAAVFLSPYDANSYYYRGLARVAAGNLQGAVKDWQKAVSLKKDFADAYYSLGYAKETLGDYKAAESYYKMALKYAEGRSVETVKEALKRLKGKGE